MGKRITGVSGPWGGLQWETVDGDKDVARRVVNFLEDRRLLFGSRHVEDQSHCVASAIEIRRYLTNEINASRSGKTLESVLKAMRAACRKFVDAAGPDGSNFFGHFAPYQADPFSLALGDLRTSMGFNIALMAVEFDIEIDEYLGSILPPDDDDPSWRPGFDDDTSDR